MSNKRSKPAIPPNEVVFYETEDGKVSIAARNSGILPQTEKVIQLIAITGKTAAHEEDVYENH